MSLPRAYLLTWTTYGTWLSGDDRAPVDAEHNTPGWEYAPSSAGRRATNTEKMAQAPFILDAESRRVACEAILAQCSFRNWELLALNVRSNHVPVLLRCGEVDPKRAARELTSWATRQLRLKKCIPADRRAWTERGTGRYVWDQESVKGAAAYVMDGQGTDLN